MTPFKEMNRVKRIRCAIFSVICTILVILFIPSIILGIWYDPYPFWKVTATQAIALFLCNLLTD